MSAIQIKLDERGKIYDQMKDLKDRAKKEDRSLTDDEKLQWEKALDDYNKIGEEIKSIKKEYEIDQTMEKLEYEQKSVFDNSTPTQRQEKKENADYRSLFVKWCRSPRSLSGKEETYLKTGFIQEMEKRGTSVQITGTDGIGGYIVPEEWQAELVKTMVAFGGMLEAGRIIQTAHGRQINVPTVPFAGGGAAATATGVLLGENAGAVVNDINFGEKVLNAYVYSSGEIVWTWEMMADSMFDVVGLTIEIGGGRVGRIVNTHLTTGTGSSQPNGVVTASTLGVTAASATVITGAELVSLKHSVNSAYRKSNKAMFMFNDTTLGEITQLSYGVGDTAVWVPSFAEGVPDRILGHPYIINDDIGDTATGVKAVLFGDFSKYWIRKAGFPEFARSDERDMANRRSVFYVFDRYDGELVDTNAIKHLIMA